MLDGNNTSLNLYNSYNYEYYGVFYFGSELDDFTLHIDTGSYVGHHFNKIYRENVSSFD